MTRYGAKPEDSVTIWEALSPERQLETGRSREIALMTTVAELAKA